MNQDTGIDEATGHIFKASRWHTASMILSDIGELLSISGSEYVDSVTYNPDDDPIYKITVRIEKL